MYKNRKTYVVIVAGGSGERMNKSLPKQFLRIGDTTILDRTINCFEKNELIDGIYLVINEYHEEFIEKEIVLDREKIKGVVHGGKDRMHSVYNGLKALNEKGLLEDSIVLVHDGVRPFVSQKMIDTGIKMADKYGAAIPTIEIVDTLKSVLKNGTVKKTLDRDKYRAAQTPQVFDGRRLFDLYSEALKEKIIVTDDASIFEHFNEKVHYFSGIEKNIKITTPFDLEIGELIASNI